MTPTTNAGNLQYDERKIFFIVDEILGFASSTNFARKVKNLSPTKLHNDVLRDNPQWDRQIKFIVKL